MVRGFQYTRTPSTGTNCAFLLPPNPVTSHIGQGRLSFALLLTVAKNNYIRLELDSQAYVLGIASNEKIWRVVWAINAEMAIDMATGHQEVTSVGGPELYQDLATDPDFEYCLFEPNDKSKKVPRKAREFRFWLSLKPKRDKAPDVTALVTRLRQLENISLVVDLSQEENIQQFLP